MIGRCAAALFLISLQVVLSIDALAQEKTVFARYSEFVSDEDATKFIDLVLENIHLVPCSSTDNCAPATSAERLDPPISVDDAKKTMGHAIVSALATWCELEPKRSFLPLMNWATESQKSNRQMSMIAALHGDFSKRQYEYYRENGRCTEEIKNRLNRAMPQVN